MQTLKQLIKEFRELRGSFNKDFKFEEKCFNDITKLLDAMEVLVEENNRLKAEIDLLWEYRKAVRNDDELSAIEAIDSAEGYRKHRQALQQADEKVR